MSIRYCPRHGEMRPESGEVMAVFIRDTPSAVHVIHNVPAKWVSGSKKLNVMALGKRHSRSFVVCGTPREVLEWSKRISRIKLLTPEAARLMNIGSSAAQAEYAPLLFARVNGQWLQEGEAHTIQVTEPDQIEIIECEPDDAEPASHAAKRFAESFAADVFKFREKRS